MTLLAEFPNKARSLKSSLKRLLRKIDASGSTDRMRESGLFGLLKM